MSREIKFRAWFNTQNRMVEHEQLEICYGHNEGFNQAIDHQFDDATFSFELMQYTGLHDDDEEQNELFKSDIVELEYMGMKHVCEIDFSAGAFIFVADTLPDGFISMLEVADYDRTFGWAEGTRKLGNKYDNPELLEASK